MVGLAFLGAVLTLGVPAGRDWAARTSVVDGADALLKALHTARTEALTRNAQVTICKSSSSQDRLPACAESTAEWSEGWVVFLDGGAIGTIEASDKVISTGRLGGKIESVTERPTRLASITFNPVGPITGPTGNLEVHLASPVKHGTFERVICLSVLGRAHIAKTGSCKA
jgi:type IV fimbrial biogenesis protein FimT